MPPVNIGMKTGIKDQLELTLGDLLFIICLGLVIYRQSPVKHTRYKNINVVIFMFLLKFSTAWK